jgi:hypothetical protein
LSYSTLPEIGLPENRRAGVSHDESRYLQTARSAHPHRRPRPYPIESDTVQLQTVPLRTGRHRRGERPDPLPAPPTEEAYLAALRDIAWARFLKHSADLAAAHTKPRRRSLAARFGAAFSRAVHRVTRTARVAPSTI